MVDEEGERERVWAKNHRRFIQQVMLLGDSGVGKTCLLVRFRDGTFLAGSFISTVGIDFRVIFFELIFWCEAQYILWCCLCVFYDCCHIFVLDILRVTIMQPNCSTLCRFLLCALEKRLKKSLKWLDLIKHGFSYSIVVPL